MGFRKGLALSLVVCSGVSLAGFGQDDNSRHGRKYKAPPVVSHIEVTVVKSYNGKPISNAAVVFRSDKDGKDEGNLEVKTDPDGKAIIDVVPTGSKLRVQVIASGFATFGEDYQIDGPTKEIAISMLRPRAQVSTYTDNNGQPSQRKPGVQEPAVPKPGVPPAGSTPPATPPVPTPKAPQSDPASTPGSTSSPSL